MSEWIILWSGRTRDRDRLQLTFWCHPGQELLDTGVILQRKHMLGDQDWWHIARAQGSNLIVYVWMLRRSKEC